MEGVFTAGDGDLSIVYQAGAHVWGAWNVNYSDGIEPEDFEADRSLGYVGDTGDAGDELAARMWIRSDVSIDQDSQSSTLPAVFRDAHERMSGDVVVERTISGPGLGGLVPYVDFHHGDEIGTVIGPKVVPLPVNGIEFSTDPDGGQDYEVHVGKGLFGNREERDLRNAQLQAQIFKEIAERKREQARLEKEAKRLEEQAATDRAQTRRISATASALRENEALTVANTEALDNFLVRLKPVLKADIDAITDLVRAVDTLRNAVANVEGLDSTAYSASGTHLDNSVRHVVDTLIEFPDLNTAYASVPAPTE